MSDDTTIKGQYAAVVYTDGSARPNNITEGFIGCGIHGYLYIPDSSQNKKTKALKDCYFTTTGYKASSDEISFVRPFMMLDYAVSPAQKGTNNRAELLAVINAIGIILKDYHNDSFSSITSIYILTDSEYTKNGILQHLKKWADRQWCDINGATIANVDLWEKILAHIRYMDKENIKYDVEWVRGNDTVVGNMQADYLSVIAMDYARNHTLVKDNIMEAQHSASDSNYWKAADNRHPMLSCRRMYYNTLMDKSTQGIYFLSDPGDGDVSIGNRNSGTGLAVIKLKTPQPVLEAVCNKQIKTCNGTVMICMADIDKIHDQQVSRYVTLFGENALIKHSSNNQILFPDNSILSQELNPARLSPRALVYFTSMEDMLGLIVSGEIEKQSSVYQIKDITDTFYDVTDKGLELKKDLVVGYKNHHVSIKRPMPNKKGEMIDTELNIALQLGVDMPSRNNLKRMESNDTKVYLIVKGTSDTSFSYYVYITMGEDCGVWTGYFTSHMVHKPKA